MRSTMFLLMLALCLVSLACAASTDEGELKHNTENQPNAVGTPTSPTAPEAPSHDVQNTLLQSPEKTTKKPESPALQPPTGKPSQAQPQLPEPEPPKPTITSQTLGIIEGQEGAVTEHGDDNPPTEDATSFSPPEKPPLVHAPLKLEPAPPSSGKPQQPQQSQAPPTNTSPNGARSQGETGNTLQSGHDGLPASTTEKELQSALAKTQPGTTPGVSGHQDPDVLQQPPKDHQKHPAPQPPASTNQLSLSSQSSGTVVQQPLERPSLPTNTDKAPTEGTHLPPNRSEKTPTDHNNPQDPLPISTDGKADLPDSNKTPKTTPDKNPVSAQKLEPFTPATADNPTIQTSTTTGDKETHTEQTSVSSTSEPEKGESTPPTSTSEKLSKVMKSLDNKDSSIGSSLLFALTTLVTLIVMSISSAS